MAATATSVAPKSPAWQIFVSSLEDALCSEALPASEASSVADEVIRRHLNAAHLLDGLRLELDTQRYRRLLLHADPQGHFCVLALVWAPNTATPVHAHHTWCAVGVASGELHEERYAQPRRRQLKAGELVETKKLSFGETTHESSCGRFVHRLANRGTAFAISLHTYGVSGERVDDGVNRILAA